MTNGSKFAYVLGAFVIFSCRLWSQVEPVTVPDMTRIDPLPQIPRIETMPRLETIPTIEVKPSIEATPRIETGPSAQPVPRVRADTSRAMVPPTPPTLDREASECTVREMRCASFCEPLPDQWSSYHACLAYQCKNTEENCLERLVNDLRGRHAASESTVTFQVKCDYQYAVRLEFYSMERNLAWPGSNESYKVDDYETHTYRLKCSSGEKICYGAGAGPLYWGVGLDGRSGCKNCCAKCGGGAASYVLK